MKVYVAKRNYDYEGFEIIGVYTERDLAEMACKDDSQYGDSHDIEELMIDEYYGDYSGN